MENAELAGRRALVTGATSGIGRATALILAARGAHVVVSGRDAERGQLVARSITDAGGAASVVCGDLSSPHVPREIARQAQEAVGGPIDILINNAGMYPSVGMTPDVTTEAIDDVYALNVRAPYLLVAELAPAMAAQGSGAIVNVLTMVAQFGVAPMALYGSSKASLLLLTKAWAAEFGPSNVRVNAVSPGPTRTEGTAKFGSRSDDLAALAPAGRRADPDEIAEAIAFLAGPRASFVFGAVLDVDGGRVAT